MTGPDTGDIGLRVGLHSGPVTAGVLRGLRGRFQLFGDSSKLQNTEIVAAARLGRVTFPVRAIMDSLTLTFVDLHLLSPFPNPHSEHSCKDGVNLQDQHDSMLRGNSQIA